MAAHDAKELERRLDRAAKLVEALRELQAKTYTVAEELQALLKGEAITGDHLRIVEGLFSDEYERRYGAKYVFQYAKDRPHWKRLIKAVGPDELCTRITAYFHEADAYRERQRHPFGLFVSQFNSLATARTLPALGYPVRDCQHTPPCTSDQEHTIRRTQDLKNGGAHV